MPPAEGRHSCPAETWGQPGPTTVPNLGEEDYASLPDLAQEACGRLGIAFERKTHNDANDARCHFQGYTLRNRNREL